MAEVTERSRWELAAESTVVKLRWFGIVMGYILVQTRTGLHDPWAVRAFLALGAGYAALDLAFWRMGEVILKGWPLLVSGMESVFIALLCYHDTGLDSPFRWYYLLSLICCSIRNRPAVAWWTLGFHTVSLLSLAWVLGMPGRPVPMPLLTLTIMAWVTWASSSLAGSLRAAGEEFARLNGELATAREELERRVEERTGALRLAGPGDPAGEDGRLRTPGRRHRPRGRQSPGRPQLAGADAQAPRAGSVHGRQARPGRPPVAADRAHRPRAGRLLPAGVQQGRPRPRRRGGRGGPRHRQVLPAHQAALDHDGCPGRPARGRRDARLPHPGRAQPRAQRHRRDRGPGEGPRRGARRGRLADPERRGRRPRDLAGRPLPAVPAFLHHQAAWHRAGPVRQPADPRGRRRAARLSLRARAGLHVHRPAAARALGVAPRRPDARAPRRPGSRPPRASERSWIRDEVDGSGEARRGRPSGGVTGHAGPDPDR